MVKKKRYMGIKSYSTQKYTKENLLLTKQKFLLILKKLKVNSNCTKKKFIIEQIITKFLTTWQ